MHIVAASVAAIAAVATLAGGLAAGTPAYADDPIDGGTITASGLEAGTKLNAYKIIDGPNTFDPEWTWSSELTTALSESEDYSTYIDPDSTPANAVTHDFEELSGEANADDAAAFYGWLAGQIGDAELTSVGEKTADADGNASWTDLNSGQYLVLANNSINYVYRPSVVTVTDTVDAAIELKRDEVTLTKTVDGDKPTAGLGDTVAFTIVSDIPQYPVGATNHIYVITDTFPDGLTLDGNSVTIKDPEGNVLYHAGDSNQQGDGLVMGVFNPDYAPQLKLTFDYSKIKQYTSLTITYDTKLNDKAKLGSTGNTNNASLEFSNDPYGNGTHKTTDDPDNGGNVKVYTYGIHVAKKGSDTNTALANAAFELYATDNDGDKTGDAIRTGLTNASGDLTFKYLDLGKYVLVETTAPEGYVTVPDQTVEIKDTDTDGTLDAGEHAADGIVDVTITDQKRTILAQTGAAGIALFILAMGSLATGAIILTTRRKAGREA